MWEPIYDFLFFSRFSNFFCCRDNEVWEPIYRHACKYLQMDDRVSVVNKRLDVLDGAQFTCFTSTKVQILTPEEL